MTSLEAIVSSAKRTKLWTQAVLVESRIGYFAAILCSINSQVTKMASFLLPIKILYIAAAPSIPNYLARLAPTLSREELVLGLSTVAILLFILHVAFEWARNTLEQRQFTSFVTELQKTNNSLNPQRTRALYRQTFSFVSAISFSALLLVLLGLIAPQLIALLLGLAFIATLLVYIFDERLQATWSNSPQAAPTTIGVICAVGFLSGFAKILQTLLTQENASVVVAIVSLIAFRLLMNQIASISNAINYHGKSGFDINNQQVDPFVFAKTQERSFDDNNFEAALRANFDFFRNEKFTLRKIDASTTGSESYLIQHPEKNQTTSLLTKSNNSPLSENDNPSFDEFIHNSGLIPKVVDVSKILGNYWTVFEGPITDIPPDEHPKAKLDLLIRLASVPIDGIKNPESTLVTQQQMGKLLAANVRQTIIKYDANTTILDEIESALEYCRKLLSIQPKQLQLRTNQGSLVYDTQRKPLAINWEQYSLVPIGTSFEGETLIFDPIEIVRSASQLRADLKDVSDEAILLAYETGRLSTALERNRYSSVSHIAVNIINLVSKHKRAPQREAVVSTTHTGL